MQVEDRVPAAGVEGVRRQVDEDVAGELAARVGEPGADAEVADDASSAAVPRDRR